MKYNSFNKSFENFQKKFDKFEEKHYLEIQNYKEFKKENFSGVEKFSRIIKRICVFIAIVTILFSIITVVAGLLVFLTFTVFK